MIYDSYHDPNIPSLVTAHPRSTTLSLAACHRRLTDDLGEHAPAEITLKRWATAGRLGSAVVRTETGRRNLYRYEEVLRIAQAQGRPNRVLKPAAPATQRMPTYDPGELARMISAQILEHLPSLARDKVPAGQGGESEATRQLLQAAASLDAMRKSLMVQYDGQMQKARAEIAELRERVRLAEQALLDQGRLSTLAAQLAALVDRASR